MKLYKYQGAGNDFLIADNRDGHIRHEDGILYARDAAGNLWKGAVADICDRRYGVGADGLMLLEAADGDSDGVPVDFRMTYFNSDGSGGMMCGNGGRCIVAFAADMGIRNFNFMAADGLHSAAILADDGMKKRIRLKMCDVRDVLAFDALEGISGESGGYFADTGTRHYVRFVEDVDSFDILSQGREIRWHASGFQPVGVNVNYVGRSGSLLKVRTYEKGVEDETFACGTGIVASCVASFVHGIEPSGYEGERIVYDVKAKRDFLSVDFIPATKSDVVATDVHLTGEAAYVAEILLR